MKRNGLVLLSGGLDSMALLGLSEHRFANTHALFVDYGQLNLYPEMAACEGVCARRQVPLHVVRIGKAVWNVPTETPKRGATRGISNANMPARNMILLACAASVVGAAWGDPAACVRGATPQATILLGATFDDQKNFPDCRRAFELAASKTAAAALSGIVDCAVWFPWRKLPKWDVLKMAQRKWPDTVADLRLSMSCYAGTRCGACDACAARAKAFRLAGIADA